MEGWNPDLSGLGWNSTDDYGFNAKPGGYYNIIGNLPLYYGDHGYWRQQVQSISFKAGVMELK